MQTECRSKGGCTSPGTFVSVDGSDVHQEIRSVLGVPPVPGAGGQRLAIDTGDPDHVYPLGG